MLLFSTNAWYVPIYLLYYMKGYLPTTTCIFCWLHVTPAVSDFTNNRYVFWRPHLTTTLTVSQWLVLDQLIKFIVFCLWRIKIPWILLVQIKHGAMVQDNHKSLLGWWSWSLGGDVVVSVFGWLFCLAACLFCNSSFFNRTCFVPFQKNYQCQHTQFNPNQGKFSSYITLKFVGFC